MYRVAIIEDHLLQRKYTVSLVSAQPDMAVTFAGEELPELVNWLEGAEEAERPDLILLDLLVDRRPAAKPEVVRRLIREGSRVLVFSAAISPPLTRQLIRAGAHGVISKRDPEASILAAMRTVLAGGQWVSPELAEIIAHDPKRPALSDQEERALVLYASGLSLESVATSIGVKPNTVKKYLQRVRDKYAAVDRPLASRIEWRKAAHDDGYLALAE
ncbi:MAG: response regulator [Leucobacter sp.]